MIISVNTLQAEGLGIFLKKLGVNGFIASKKMAEKILKNPG